MILLMLVKKVVYQLMAAGPILLLGLIAVNSRAKVDKWQFIEYGPETSARLIAYTEPVRDVRSRFIYKRDYDEQDVLESMSFWLEEYRAGKLKDIHPATTVSEGSTSTYHQIVSARHRLLFRAKELANTYKEDEEYIKAADLYADIIEVANIAKYGEFSILADSSSTQSDALLRLVDIAPYLTDEKRVEIYDRINSLEDPTRSLSHVVNRISAVYRLDLNRQGRSTAIIEAARSNYSLASKGDIDQLRIEEWRKMSSADRALIPLYARSRIAYLNQIKYRSSHQLANEALVVSEEISVS